MSGVINEIGKGVNYLFLGLPGALLNAMTPKPPTQTVKLGELSRQTAKEAEPRIVVWGRFRPIGGNIIHCQQPVIKWVTTTTKVGGKGGKKKKQKTKTQHVYRSYAIGVCEGPISKFIRIWRNGKLVYDARGNAWGTTNNNVFTNQARLYTGSWTQNPDPTLQSIWGSANVPAYRGTAYIVVINEDLTELGGAIPYYQFEVERAEGYFLTSRPYDIVAIDEMVNAVNDVRKPPQFEQTPDAMSGTIALTDGLLRDTLHSYTYPIEGFDITIALQSGSLADTLVPYTYTIEGFDIGITLQSGSLVDLLVEYTNYLPEGFDISVTLTGGSLA